MLRRRRYARPPPGLVGIEVLPTLPHAAAAVERARAAELEFWAAIIPPITADEWAAARDRREGRAGIEHSRSAHQCPSARSGLETDATVRRAQAGPVKKGIA